MAIRQVRTKEDPILRKTSREVGEINERIVELSQDMLETMYKEDGIGLAAPQVGVLRRLFVIDMRDNKGPEVYINPVIRESSLQEDVDIEGCLSVPGEHGYVKRPTSIVLDYQNIKGEKKTVEAEGYFARCIQHEFDHLDGILYIDKLEDLTEEEIKALENKESVDKND